jgi:abequosyltransferase
MLVMGEMYNEIGYADISILIPNYKRLSELTLCLDSILAQDCKPLEVIVHDDSSPNQKDVVALFNEYKVKFNHLGISSFLSCSEENIGYDASLRKLIELAGSSYVLFIGNDDYLMPCAIEVYRLIMVSKEPLMVSRNFNKFTGFPPKIVGVSRFSKVSVHYSKKKDAYMAFRLSAYFGGLLFKTSWARSVNTDFWDGSLYYQFYLALKAFTESGIFCVSETTVAARIDGVPLFGETDKARIHAVGRYTVEAREKMWRDVLSITSQHDLLHETHYLPLIQRELKIRMSFHIFEMFAMSSRAELIELWRSLRNLNLLYHPIPVLFWLWNFIAGRRSRYLYIAVRRYVQN